MAGPLAGVTVVEIAGIGPAPFAGMMLADLGARVIRVDRPGRSGYPGDPRHDLQGRGKRSIAVDLKAPGGADVVLALAGRADALIEGFRPGVAERLGIGPEPVHAVNPALVYGRMTGWGQQGPYAHTAGHDITYLAVSGALHAVGPPGAAPVPPVNLLGDYGGGGMLLVSGVLAGLVSAARTGAGQVVDVAIVDGAALLTTQLHGLLHSGLWRDERGVNLLDGGAPFYGVYRAADDRYLAVGALEAEFYDEFVTRLELPADAPDRYDIDAWPRLRELIAERFATRTSSDWYALFADTDGCVAPVLSLGEAAATVHPQLRQRDTFVEVDGVRQPAPAPRFSATPAAAPALPPPYPGEHSAELLAEFDLPEADSWLARGLVSQHD